jgi:hypothetical protein
MIRQYVTPHRDPAFLLLRREMSVNWKFVQYFKNFLRTTNAPQNTPPPPQIFEGTENVCVLVGLSPAIHPLIHLQPLFTEEQQSLAVLITA